MLDVEEKSDGVQTRKSQKLHGLLPADFPGFLGSHISSDLGFCICRMGKIIIPSRLTRGDTCRALSIVPGR